MDLFFLMSSLCMNISKLLTLRANLLSQDHKVNLCGYAVRYCQRKSPSLHQYASFCPHTLMHSVNVNMLMQPIASHASFTRW